MNGYSLARFFLASQNWVWSAPRSQIYSALKSLEDDGLIDASREEGRNGLVTKVYSLSRAGGAELDQWVSTPQPPSPHRDAFAVQALHFDAIDPEDAATVLRAYLDDQRRQLSEWENHRDALASMSTPLLKERLASRPGGEHHRIAALKAHVFEGQAMQARARIAWAEQALELVTASASVAAPTG
jgi:DNA-binding PadR family transcriptional regulator